MRVLLPFLLIALTAGPAAAETVLVTGSSRGIGLELVRQYAERGWTVIATARDPNESPDLRAFAATHKNVVVERIDVGNLNDIASVSEKYKAKPIDLLINNAGIIGDVPKEHFGNLDYEVFAQMMKINAYAPLAMAQAFKGSIARSGQKKIVSLASGAGVLSGPAVTVPYIDYGLSKAALNFGMRAVNGVLKKEGIIVGLVDPGPTDTAMRREALTNEAALQNKTADQLGPRGHEVPEVAAGIMRVIDGLTLENADKHYTYDGKIVPW